MNKAKLLKMYIGGEHVNKIAEECGCSVKMVYDTAARCGYHRRGHVRAKKEKPKPEPKPKDEIVPMYREIPDHISVGPQVSDVQKKLQAELKAYRDTHQMPWYLK